MKGGYVALITVLIISAVIVTISVSSTIISLQNEQGSLETANGEQALASVEGCAEDGLLYAAKHSTYAGGTITISHPDGICSITISESGNVWTMTATLPNNTYNKSIQVVFDNTSSGITLISWNQI